MFEKDAKVNDRKYVSCIKVNGVPILPPLITHAKRKELHKYKQQAIKLEKRLRREHELKDYINKYYTQKLEDCTNILFSNTLEHRLSFDNIIYLTNNNENSMTDLRKDELPFQKKTPTLSCDLQVSQYANNEFTVLTSFEKVKSNSLLKDESTSSVIDNFTCTSNCFENEESEIVNQPRLIRSNSYVLETPSPMLLEHLRRQTESVDENSLECKSDIHRFDYKQDSRISSADLHAIKKGQDCDSVYIDDCSNRCILSVSRSESELKNISTFSDRTSDNGDLTVMGSHHRLKEFIDNNLPQMLNDNDLLLEGGETQRNTKLQHTDNNKIENSFSNPIEYCENPERSPKNCDNQNLRKILENIPEMYSKQIIELLDKQEQEQLSKAKTNGQYFNNCNSKIEIDYKRNNSTYEEVQTIKSLPNFKQHTRFIESLDNSLTNVSTLSDYGETTKLPAKLDILSDNFMNCSCEFANCNRKTKQPFRKDHAASIIVAAAKGYLVRRLMRTDRIQGLIQTIKDALVCAMQLHSESTETINESDIELHRRLIQQVSAACIEFHEVFFTLSAPERMTIIKFDRERQKEKLKRPLSRASSVSKSSRSFKSIAK